MHKFTTWQKEDNKDIIRLVDIVRVDKKNMFTIQGLLTTGIDKMDPLENGEYYFDLYEKHKDVV